MGIDNRELLKESREYFRSYISTHIDDYRAAVIDCKTGLGNSYPSFYRDNEVIDCLRSIFHNLEGFGGVTIPTEFASPRALIETWQNFYNYLITMDELFSDVAATLNSQQESASNFPFPFICINEIHNSVKHLFEYILDLEEVKEVSSDSKEKKASTVKRKYAENIEADIDIAIITAMHEPELARVKEIIENLHTISLNKDPTVYKKGIIRKPNGKELSVIIASDSRMGMPAAATLATKIIFNFNPKYLVMLGICAGIKGKVNLGDIIITEYAWDYGSGKHEQIKSLFGRKKDLFKPYINQIQLHASIETKLKHVVSEKKYVNTIQEDWQRHAGKSTPAQLKAVMGAFVSGAAVIANEKIVSQINSRHGSIYGFDMEAYAVFNATRYGGGSNNVKPLVIKSVSDFGDSEKNCDNKDELQDYAAYTSAQFFLQIAKEELEY